ncbi:MAG: adenylate kinase [Prevotellaceae bacterium]|jgi:adenylate kinase|nr:adenylate kinase [Prevotellaceae bacterium]
MLNIVLFGAPGAGKGTQATKLVEKYNLVHLSTGDMLRDEIARRTKYGIIAQQLINNGQLAPDSMVIAMIAEKIIAHKASKGFIFDGFPRTIPQAEMLDSMLPEHGLCVTGMVALSAPEDELVRRLLFRGQRSGRADDQNEEIIRNRIAVYHEKTAPLIEYYAAQGKHVSTKGVGSVDEIFLNLCSAIDNFRQVNAA